MATSSDKPLAPAHITIRMLGRFEILRNDESIPEDAWGRRKTLALLKILLLSRGRVFSKDELIEALYGGDDPQKKVRNLQGRVSELRRALEPELHTGTDSQYVLRIGAGYCFGRDTPCWVDTEAFLEQITTGREHQETGHWRLAIEGYEKAMELYRGDLLEADRYEEWAEQARGELRSRYLDSMIELATCYEKLGRLRQAISCCQRVLALKPYREDVIRHLMSYQAEAGQRLQALETYREAYQALREHLDVEPSTETQALFARLSEVSAVEQRTLDPRRIAVLPLVSYSPHPEDAYFADGMTEELIANLSRIKDFRVVARTSMMKYRGTTKSIKQISRELGAGSLLEGSVRKTGERARITAQLIDGVTEDHLWADDYNLDVGDVLEVQAEIARRVSESLKLELLSDEEDALRTVGRSDSEAHMAYLRGRHFLQKYTKEALETAIGHFEKALEKDPAYVRALAGLADAYCRMEWFTSSEGSYRRSKAYAEQALALDDSLPEVYTALAYVAGGYEGDLVEPERLLRRAIQLDPSYALAHAHLGKLLAKAERLDEAVEAFRTALTLDPLSPHLIAQYASCLFNAKRYISAVDQARRALELDPENDSAWWIVWFSHAALWDWKRGEAILREMVERYPENPLAYVFLSVSVQTNGRIAEGVSLLEKALSLPGARERLWLLHQGGINFAMAQQYDRALDLLDEAVERWPMSIGPHIVRAFCYFLQGRFDQCLEEVAVAETLFGSGWDAYIPRLRGRVYAARGEIEKAEAELEKLIKHTEYVNRRMCIAYVLAGLGRIEEAIDWFEEAADAHEIHISTIRKLPTTPRALREHPGFVAFLSRVGLADAPKSNEVELEQKKA